MTKRSEIKKQKIDAILDYGIEAFREKGYHYAGVQDLASACRISKGSFYQYFGSKENFSKMVIQRYSVQINSFISDLLDSAKGNGQKKIIALFTHMVNSTSQKNFEVGCLYGDLGAELGGVNASCSSTLNKCMSTTISIVEEAIKLGQTDGSIRQDIDSEELTSIIMNSWGGSILKMKIERDSKPGKLFIKHIVKDYLTPS